MYAGVPAGQKRREGSGAEKTCGNRPPVSGSAIHPKLDRGVNFSAGRTQTTRSPELGRAKRVHARAVIPRHAPIGGDTPCYRGTQRLVRTICLVPPTFVWLPPTTRLICPTGHVPSSTNTTWPSRIAPIAGSCFKVCANDDVANVITKTLKMDAVVLIMRLPSISRCVMHPGTIFPPHHDHQNPV